MYRQPQASVPMLEQMDDETAARRDALIRRAEESRQPFEPEVALFLDGSAESEQVRQMMEAAMIPFRTFTDAGPDIPAAVFGGMCFIGQANIGELVRTLKAIEVVLISNLQRTMPHLFDANDERSKRRPRGDARPTSASRAKTA